MKSLEREKEILEGYHANINSVWVLLNKLLKDLEKLKSEIRPIEYDTVNTLHLIFTRERVEEIVNTVGKEVGKIIVHECFSEAIRSVEVSLRANFRSHGNEKLKREGNDN